MIAIKTENLTKIYKGKKNRTVYALTNLNLEIAKGEIFGFLGPNGAGKSTTIKLLMSLIYPTSGTFTIFNEKTNCSDYKQNIGFLPENPLFYEYLTGEELLLFVGKAFGMQNAEISSGTEKYLKLLELWEERRRVIRTYSKGMIQRLAFAQALLHNPEIFILDEPMSGLDPLGRILIRDLILKLKEDGKTVFMSTHILNDVETICDRVGILVKGELKLVEFIKNIMEKGVKGYMITFKTISESLVNFLTSISNNISCSSFQINQEDLSLVLEKISNDKQTEVQIIEPIRKGIEELFMELINE